MDEELKHLSLREVRDELDHLFKLRQALQMTKAQISSPAKKQELDRMIKYLPPHLVRRCHSSANWHRPPASKRCSRWPGPIPSTSTCTATAKKR